MTRIGNHLVLIKEKVWRTCMMYMLHVYKHDHNGNYHTQPDYITMIHFPCICPINQINITYQMSWRRSSFAYCNDSTITSGTYLGEGFLSCSVGCNGDVGTMLHRCTAFSERDDWSYGRNEYQYNATGISYFELQWVIHLRVNFLQAWYKT